MTASSDPRLSYCGEQVRRFDHDRYLTCLFAPAAAREDLFALYAFNHEIAKVAEIVTEPMAGQIRIQWWREGLDDLYAGEPRKHEVAEALAGAVQRHGLTRQAFERLLDARETDLDDDPPETLDHLTRYAEETSATLVQLALEVLGAHDDASMRAGRHVGVAWALTGIARAVPFHAAQRRLMLPGNLTWQAGLDVHDLFELREPAEVQPVVRQVTERAEDHLREAEALRRRVPRDAVPALLPATLARRYLALLKRHEHDPFAPEVQRPQPGRPMRLAWAAARGRF
ncbi:phytoene synthase [Limimonas halophila]|uniref:Phytoene synthase n=1 Tax=Limimonas halophila TaxID=1082479 RepID=A0A1G7NHU2_9PROT|nr:phytoene/squalene synthase family protein [Limimonas halophila]SDF73658.1 phytoene synthase [Limimonas halophila]